MYILYTYYRFIDNAYYTQLNTSVVRRLSSLLRLRYFSLCTFFCKILKTNTKIKVRRISCKW